MATKPDFSTAANNDPKKPEPKPPVVKPVPPVKTPPRRPMHNCPACGRG